MSNNELNNVKDALRQMANQLDVMCQTSGTHKTVKPRPLLRIYDVNPTPAYYMGVKK